ncbi:zinc finger protein 17 isoform X8 [Marmota monax]|uniref:zinc finger protein 17 isoform X8 n=1 Tax=Marmota monax TaxID=9995 RepID=UPI001EB0134F|nr:zinc finger protein 17 isoform X8 [Marmota monax]
MDWMQVSGVGSRASLVPRSQSMELCPGSLPATRTLLDLGTRKKQQNKEEWGLLDEAQRLLYLHVMLENFALVTSLDTELQVSKHGTTFPSMRHNSTRLKQPQDLPLEHLHFLDHVFTGMKQRMKGYLLGQGFLQKKHHTSGLQNKVHLSKRLTPVTFVY